MHFRVSSAKCPPFCSGLNVLTLNSLWTRDSIWWHRSGSTSAQVMACCLMAPSHYLNQCWPLVSQVLCHSHENNFAARAKVNPSRAKFFRGNINIYLHFVSFLHIDRTQVVEILPQIRPRPTYSTWSISWLLMSWRHKEPGHQQPWYWPS